MFKVLCQRWEESEREAGWGVSVHDDGYSLHKTEEDRKAFIKEYWDGMPKETPDYYSRPCGLPQQAEVTEELYLELTRSKNGIRTYDNALRGILVI